MAREPRAGRGGGKESGRERQNCQREESAQATSVRVPGGGRGKAERGVGDDDGVHRRERLLVLHLASHTPRARIELKKSSQGTTLTDNTQRQLYYAVLCRVLGPHLFTWLR